MRYTDPSGHQLCAGWELYGDCLVITGTINSPWSGQYFPGLIQNDTLPVGVPGGLKDDGLAAFRGMTILQSYSDDVLSSEDWLAFVIETEYLGSQGPNPAWNAAMARRYRANCSGGAFTAKCFNNFWGYMQAVRKTDKGGPDIKSFIEWVVSPTAGFQANIKLANNIAYSIQNPYAPNSYGISPSMTSCAGYRCDWVTIKPGKNGDPNDPNSFYSYIYGLSKSNNWIYPSGENFDLLLTVQQIIDWFTVYPHNMTNETKAP